MNTTPWYELTTDLESLRKTIRYAEKAMQAKTEIIKALEVEIEHLRVALEAKKSNRSAA